jgi:nucleotide-binding universal stress UspA family protein
MPELKIPEDPVLLVVVDQSEWAIRVLNTARAMAHTLDSRLHVLHCCQSPEELPPHEEYLTDLFTKTHLAMNSLRSTSEVVCGEPIQEILGAIDRVNGVMMLVMGTHGETGSQQALLGHVTGEVIKQAKVPVLLTRRNMNIPVQINRILVPLDGSPQAASIVPFAAQIAERCGGRVDLFHVVGSRAELVNVAGSMAPPRYMDHPIHEWGAWEHEFLERFFQPGRYEETKIPVRLYMGHGEVAPAIVKASKHYQSDLVACGWSGRLEEKHGAVLKSLLIDLQCPLLVYHG